MGNKVKAAIAISTATVVIYKAVTAHLKAKNTEKAFQQWAAKGFCSHRND